MPEKIIEVANLYKSYNGFNAVDGLNFEVYKGDVFGFLGPNGAGKSTTIRMLLSLIQPTSGSISIFGKPIAEHRNFILRNTGCIVEKPDFYNYLSGLKNLEIVARLSGVQPTKKQIDELLELVHLSGKENNKVKTYSHGMKQRLGLAAVLIHNPQLIILDEPTTGLDPQGIIDIRNLILRLKHEYQKTILLSSHILSEIELIANRMVILNKGKAILQGEVNTLLHAEDVLVSIKTKDDALLHTVLSQSEWATYLQDNSSVLNMPQERIPALTTFLCAKGMEIYGIESKRKLEDLFLNLVNSPN